MSNNEISALLRLIDDPDNEVYDTVANKLMDYGKEIIPKLEQLWEHTIDVSIQSRIELLIHRVHFNELQQDFLEWSKAENPDLLKGAILIARYQYPDLSLAYILTQFEHMRRNIWMELNNYLTPLEQANVINSILYNYYKLNGHELTEREPKHFCLNHMLESRQGNSYSIGILYLALCDVLDIPIFAVDVPRQFIFAYIDTLHSFFSLESEGINQVKFYIDPISGMIYTHKDVETYLKKINVKGTELFYAPILSKRIIYKMLEELALCYRYKRDEEKADEIQLLMQLMVANEPQ